MINSSDILETIQMIEQENLDIRTITMGISLRDCCGSDIRQVCNKVYDKITRLARDLVPVGEAIERKYGIPIVNKRISVTPISLVAESCDSADYAFIARALDRAAKAVGVNFIGGYSALVHKGYTTGDRRLIDSIPEALATTDLVCSSVNIGSTRAGLNMDAVREMGKVIKKTADLTADRDAIGAAKLVVFCNAVEDNPFMAGAFHGVGEGECVINVGVSGPGVVAHALRAVPDGDFSVVADTVKKTAFKITRVGQLVAYEAANALHVPFGIVDLSLAPTPAVGDSVAYILEEMGLECCGTHGTTAALALLNDAVKKGGIMASSHVGGLSGAFIPVSEDAGMIHAAQVGALSIEKLEAMTAVCSVGLDMIVVPGDTTAATISGVIADEAAIGMVNHKTTAVRIIPAPGKGVGEELDFGGLLGRGPVMPLSKYSCERFIGRGGRIPAPLQSLKN
ncbi:MAG: PFL family protein [Clostridiaceae bacterium]|nr:PFL family protein [Clostridiaceae bacterium]